MEWKSCMEEARKWTTADKSLFELTKSIEAERKLVFNSFAGNVSFFVVCPDTADKAWEVWSEDQRVIAQMQDILEFIQTNKSTSLVEILSKTAKELSSILGASGCDDDSGQEDDGGDDGDDDDDDVDDGYEDDIYYAEDDVDALKDNKPIEEPTEAEKMFSGQSNNPVATQRLLKDLKTLDSSKGKFQVSGKPRGDNLFIWDVQLTSFPKDTNLGKDLEHFAKKYNLEPIVYMEMKFPKEYPMAPPFVRVVKPRFQFQTGHVTIGGSICMEVLTKSGWMPTNDIESILVQIRAEIMSDPKTRLDSHNANKAYDETEARIAFDRMVKRYGWQ